MTLICPHFLVLFFALLDASTSQRVLYPPTSDFDPSQRIVGGEVVTNRTAFFYVVSVRVRTEQFPAGSHICGGSLISPRFVLTAAQCVIVTCSTENTENNLLVVAGDLVLDGSTTTVTRTVSRVVVHPDYNLLNARHDVAIFELSADLFLNNITVGVIPLVLSKPSVNTTCVVSGWGHTSWGAPSYSNELRQAQVTVVNGDSCRAIFNTTRVLYREGMLCAGHLAGGRGTCQGDSGGPLVCGNRQVGIVSFTQQCGLANVPTVYTDVAYVADWIQNVTGIVISAGIVNQLSMGLFAVCLFAVLLIRV